MKTPDKINHYIQCETCNVRRAYKRKPPEGWSSSLRLGYRHWLARYSNAPIWSSSISRRLHKLPTRGHPCDSEPPPMIPYDARKSDRCMCQVCQSFRRTRRECGKCDCCGRTDLDIADRLPDMVREFLGYETLCYGCRNSVMCAVTEWGLCWAASPDEALKWALVHYVRTRFFGNYDMRAYSQGHTPRHFTIGVRA